MEPKSAMDGGIDDSWSRVRRLLDAAERLPAAERSEFLKESCPDDTLRAEIESVLASGQTLSHYRIETKIGEGGMGAVYKAVDTSLDRSVALKIISRPTISAEDKRRFAREAKAASALNHPNIVTIYEHDSYNGVDFIAMEFVDGISLDKLLKQRSTPLPKLLDYARQVAAAVAKAHAAGLVHRDLKPGNIIITHDGVAKVLDFGLAKNIREHVTPEDATASMSITQAGVVTGTPAYMSPEQALGEPVDHQSDVFSFGVILYELVSGHRPFRGEDTLATLRQVVNKDPEPLPRSVPSDVAGLIGRCLEKRKKDRLSSLTEAVPILSADHIARPSRVRAVAAMLVLLVMVVLALWFWFPRRAMQSAQNPLAGSPSELTLQARELVRRYDRSGHLDRAIQLLNAAIEKDQQFAAAYALLAEAYLRKGLSVTSSDDHWLKLARNSANQAVAANPDLASAHGILAAVLLDSKAPKEARTEAERAIELDPLAWEPHFVLARMDSAEPEYRKAVELGASNWIPHSEYGKFLYKNSRYEEAVTEWEEALRLAPDNVYMLRNLGAAYHMLDNFDRAASYFQKALEIEPRAGVWSNLGTSRFFQGSYAQSVEAFEKAVKLEPNNYLYWANLGDGYRWSPGQRAKAPENYRQAIRLVRDLLNREPQNSEWRARLALYLAKSGDADAAQSELAALVKLPKTRPADQFHMALAYEILKQRDLALRSLESAVRGGYSLREVKNEPELAAMRNDVRYHQLFSNPRPYPDRARK